MAGRTIRICPPRDFDFSGLAADSPAETMTVTVAERIDCSQYDAADLIVRVVSDLTTGEASSQMVVNLVSDGFTPDDPSIDYFSSAIAAVTFQYSATARPAGTLEIASTAGDLGSMLAVQVVGTQSTSMQGTLSGRLAIDLVLKTSD